MGSAKIWASIYQQFPVSDMSMDVSLTHYNNNNTKFVKRRVAVASEDSFPTAIPLVMMRPVALMAQSVGITDLSKVSFCMA